MKKIFFIAVALFSFTVSAAYPQSEKTVLVSNIETRNIAVDMPLYCNMASEEGGYYWCKKDSTDRMTEFVSIASAYDALEKKSCVKIRIAKNQKMVVLSFFGGWAQEIQGVFGNFDHQVEENDENLALVTSDGSQITLSKKDFEQARVKVVDMTGWQSFNE